jgi:hypothetical protein
VAVVVDGHLHGDRIADLAVDDRRGEEGVRLALLQPPDLEGAGEVAHGRRAG